MSKKAHITFNALIGFIIFGLLFYLVQVAYWQFYPYKTAEIVVPMEVLNKDNKVAKNENLELFLLINKQSDYTPKVSRNLLCDSGVYFVPSVVAGGNARPKGEYTATVKYPIPDEIPVGSKCYFIFNNEYKVNPIRVINKQWESEPFTIVEAR